MLHLQDPNPIQRELKSAGSRAHAAEQGIREPYDRRQVLEVGMVSPVEKGSTMLKTVSEERGAWFPVGVTENLCLLDVRVTIEVPSH